MGQKIHPVGFRLAVSRKYKSSWFAAKNSLFAQLLNQDISVRQYLEEELNKKKKASVSRIEIERPAKSARVTIFTARPGVVIGKKGEDIEVLRNELQRRMGVPVHVNIEEVRKPEIDAQLIADSIAQQLERRVMFRRARKRAMQNAMRLGVQGIKISCAGRLNGIEIARTEWSLEGRMPLHTISSDIDWGRATAQTQYGAIGVTVLVFKGNTFGSDEASANAAEAPEDKRPRRTRTANRGGDKAGRSAGSRRAGGHTGEAKQGE